MKAAVSEATTRHAPSSTRPRASLRPSAAAPSLAGVPSASVIALRVPGAGAPLAGAVRTPLERSLGIDLGAVRVHGDAAARAAVAATGARALAFGPRIFLGPRESGADLGVMAHEVAHVVQQQGGATVQRLGGDTGGLEREAVAAAGAVGRGEAFEVTGRTRTRPMFLFDGLRRAAGAVVGAVGDVIGTALGWVRERANVIPGYRLISLILRRDPLTGEAVAFSTANLLRAMLELNPIGTVIRVALDRYGIVDRVAGFVDQQMATLAGVLGSIGGAVMAFLRSLGPLDIVRPGAVIDRARRLIEEPIARMRAFISTLTEGIATFVRDAVLRPLAELASRTRAWDLLCAVLGRNPITGEAVARNAETLIGGFMKLIGQEEVWENIKRGNAVARAWAWFQGTLAGVLAFVRELPQRFLDTLRSLSIGDLVAPLAAFGRIASTFGAFVGQFLGWAGGQVLRLLEIIVEVVAPAILPYLKRAAGAFATIIRDPIRFVGNLVRAALTGFRQFGTNILDHLRTGLIGWLTGAMGGTGVHIPTALSLSEILKFVLSVLSLTWQAVRLRLVRVVGETAVAGLEQGFDMVRRLVTEGPAAAWQMIVEAVGNLRDMVVEQVMGFVRSRIVQAAITRLIASLNPAGAFIQAILAIYNTIMFLVERLQQIAQVAAGVIDSIAAIAGGVISQAANAVERTAARLLPVVIAFLARLIGLGNVGEVVTRFLDRVRRPIERALERVVDWIVAQARRLGRAVVVGRPAVDTATRTAPVTDPVARRMAIERTATAIDALILRQASAREIASAINNLRTQYRWGSLDLQARPRGGFEIRGGFSPSFTLVTTTPSMDPRFIVLQVGNIAGPAPSETTPLAFEQGASALMVREILPALFPRTTVRRRKERVTLTADQAQRASSRARPGQALVFNEPRIPSVTGSVRSRTGVSYPDLLVLTRDFAISIEVTLRSQWNVDTVLPGEAGARIHKGAQAPSLTLNLEPHLAANPLMHLLLTIVSNQAPDETARAWIERFLSDKAANRVIGFVWVIVPTR